MHLDFPRETGKKTVVDVMPSHIGLGVPFAYFGHLPTFFDAPALHPRTAGSFAAEAFLCKPPLHTRAESIEFIAGFRWGYNIEGASGKLNHFPVKQIGASIWAKNRRLIMTKYPKWKLRGSV
ncbi:MAG: hypothetical protein KGL74_07445 [Elusimicrobia bacterium]|nr:hypothetical protein [Elusimicrobiota bacterium]